MGVVFDEVVAEVEAPGEPRQSDNEGREQQSPPPSPLDARNWRQQLATFTRRQLRLEAD